MFASEDTPLTPFGALVAFQKPLLEPMCVSILISNSATKREEAVWGTSRQLKRQHYGEILHKH